MDILRRNTDYALRAMLHLAVSWRQGQGAVSASKIAHDDDIPYKLACKLLYMLRKAKLVRSSSGPTGGFELRKPPRQIRLIEIIGAVQGSVVLTGCLSRGHVCSRPNNCAIREKLKGLQTQIDNYFSKTTLLDMLKLKRKK